MVVVLQQREPRSNSMASGGLEEVNSLGGGWGVRVGIIIVWGVFYLDSKVKM